MKKYDLIKLNNSIKYKEFLSDDNIYGIIMSVHEDSCKVLFMNKNILGDATIFSIDKSDIEIQNEKLPASIKLEIENNINLEKLINKPLQFQEFKNYNHVELTVEDEKYAKYGIHKGDTGIVSQDSVINNTILVDFSGIDENGNFYGDTIPVNIKHIKKTTKK